jgi:hypothetical protein
MRLLLKNLPNSGSSETKTARISVNVVLSMYTQKLVFEIRNVHSGMRLVFQDPARQQRDAVPFTRRLNVAFVICDSL